MDQVRQVGSAGEDRLRANFTQPLLRAYLLAGLGSTGSPSAKNILAILEAGGINSDAKDANKVVDALPSKPILGVGTENVSFRRNGVL